MEPKRTVAGLGYFVLGIVFLLNLFNIFPIQYNRSIWIGSVMLFEFVTTLLVVGGLILLVKGSEWDGVRHRGIILVIVAILMILILLLSSIGVFSYGTF